MSFSTSINSKKCIICQCDESQEIVECGLDGLKYSCPFCGEYTISGSLISTLDGDECLSKDFLTKIPAIASEAHLISNEKFELTICNIDLFLRRFPCDYDELLDRSMLNLFRALKRPLCTFTFTPNHARYFFDNEYAEAQKTINVLQYLEYIKTDLHALNNPDFSVQLTYTGWKHANQLYKNIQKRKTAFIAMWFDKTTNAYRDATKKAIQQAGYVPIIVDEVMHNDFIMDKVLNLIKEARFIIADFSCIAESEIDKKIKNGVRGGVYYEAGYAKGLGLEVIHTCNEDAFGKRLHFDVQQKNTIVWKESDNQITTHGNNYIDYLKEHIIATVGKGSDA